MIGSQQRVACEWQGFASWPEWMQNLWFEVTISEFVKWSWEAA